MIDDGSLGVRAAGRPGPDWTFPALADPWGEKGRRNEGGQAKRVSP